MLKSLAGVSLNKLESVFSDGVNRRYPDDEFAIALDDALDGVGVVRGGPVDLSRSDPDYLIHFVDEPASCTRSSTISGSKTIIRFSAPSSPMPKTTLGSTSMSCAREGP